ncbi:hypothetical protein BKA69DRAFT_1093692 [Paraphysoderma sedebokerense]|nr:hypothetical protein BKA69DRAFT_1093692 [Paraphysoderma sedebokerense]
MFTLYELLGVLTNLLGGILGSRIGLKPCLLAGLFSFSGIAKDLVKMSGKSITKLVTKESDSGGPLFRLVANLTGAKNSIKGIGYFLGSVILIPGFYVALGILTGVTSVVAIPSWIFVDSGLGISKSGEKLTLKRIFRKDRNVTILSLSRFFLFGSRDLWFEIALPVYLRGVLEWSYYQTGLFLAVWVIIYGIVQSSTPKFILQPLKMYPLTTAKPLIFWTGILALVTLLNSLLFTFISPSMSYTGTVLSLVMGLGLFAIVFAVNSSIHSYLILKFSNRDKVAVNVGFYYMANSMGRLVGTIVSGVMYVETGLMGCLWISLGFVVLGEIVNLLLL